MVAGVAMLDPHGDLVEKILAFVPKERVEDVIYFNPPDLERPLGFKYVGIRCKYPEQKTFAVNEMINIFDKLYDLKKLAVRYLNNMPEMPCF